MTEALTKQQAHHRVLDAVRRGALVRPKACSRCGQPDSPMKDGRTSIQAHHHRGYGHPLDVEWLCVGCHREETPRPYGAKAHASKAGWNLVTTIRERYAAGESYYRIADELGLNRTTIHRIVTNRSWPEHARPKEVPHD